MKRTILFALFFSTGISAPAIAQIIPAIPFEHTIVATEPVQTLIGHVKAIGDCNGDGFPDIVVTSTGNGAGWYEYPSWAYHEMAAASFLWRGDDVEAVDIDGDGDDDVIGSSTDNGDMYVFENPLPEGDPNDPWPQHLIGSNGTYLKDVEIADIDGDGRLDVITRTNTTVSIFLQTSLSSWDHVRLLSALHANEGMDVGDLDDDGDPDIVLNGYWLETPSDLAIDGFAEHTIDTKWYDQTETGWRDNNSKVAVADIDGNGTLDVLLSNSEQPGYPVSWYEASDPRTSWTEHVIAQVDNAHTLQPTDADLDGDLDLFTAQMVDGSGPYPVLLLINEGQGLAWSTQVLATTGIYGGIVGDIGSDGDIDLVGVRNIELDQPKHLELWENKKKGEISLDSWSYIEVDGNRAKWGDFDPPTWAAYFGLALGDIRGIGLLDIVSGRYFYRNPGGDMTDIWQRIDFGLNVDAMLIEDVDGDALGDVIAEALPDVYWLEGNADGSSWTPHVIGQIPTTSHGNSQCYVSAQLIPGGTPELFFDGSDGTYYFEIPTSNQEAGNWPRTKITSDSYACGAGDIDGDGLLDVIGATYGSPREVAWWKNPGNGSPDWQMFVIGGVVAEVPDRFEAADINGDGRLDVIVAEERFDQPAADLNTFWFEAPTDPASGSWNRHTVATQFSTNSLGLGDMDNDGDIDIVTGEHKGTLNVDIWENDGSGSGWLNHPVDTGHESHIGTRLADLDRDGDLDIVSHAFDEYRGLHLWRNDAHSTNVPADTTPPTLLSADSLYDPNKVTVQLSEEVMAATAEDTSNYWISDGIGINAAQLSADGRTVTLTCDTLSDGVDYIFYTQNMADTATPPNTMLPASTTLTYSDILLPNGLVAYYPFIGDMKDYSGNGNHGSCSACPRPTEDINGVANSAFAFNGTSNFVSAASSPSLSDLSALSISVWYRPLGSPGSDGGRIVGKEQGPGGNDYALIHNANLGGKRHFVRFFVNIDEDVGVSDSNAYSVNPASGWHHVVGVWSDDLATIYFDGIEVSSDATTGVLATSGENFIIGGMGLSNTRRVNGTIDEVRLYDRALSQTEITTLFEAQPVATIAEPPAIAPDGGTFTGSPSIEISSPTPGAEIFYTIDGTTPTQSSQPFSSPFTLSQSAEVKAIAIEVGLDASPVSSASFSITADIGGAWWDSSYRYRIPIFIDPGDYDRVAGIAEAAIDFSQVLHAYSDSYAFNEDSLRVIEIDSGGLVIDPAVVHQFDKASDFDSATNAVGTIVIQMSGVSATARRYQVYFDTIESAYTPPSFAPQVIATDGVQHEAQESIQVATPSATYYYHKLGAGFASIEDPDGNDWIGHHATGDSAGNFRGLPNLNDFHPGLTSSWSQLVHSGPLKTTIYSESNDTLWAATWEIYPNSATMTLEKAGFNYWFLYEGTPGGSFDLTDDYVVRSNGLLTPASEDWVGDVASPEWVYFGDTKLNRVLYVAHHEDDVKSDQFWNLDGNMTVFGFGRQYQCCDSYLQQVPAHFTIGFAEQTAFADVEQVINSAYQPLSISISPGARFGDDPIGQPTAIPAMSPVARATLVLLVMLGLGAKAVRHRTRDTCPSNR